MEGSNIVSLVLYTHALEIVLSGPFTCEPNTVRFVTKSCPYNWRRLWEELVLACITSNTTFSMEGVEPPHPAAGLHQGDVSPHQAESRGSQRGGPRKSPEQREVQIGRASCRERV